MAATNANHYQLHQTGLIVKVPEAEPVVGAWRSKFDTAAVAGVPAHITVLYPFLDEDRLTGGVLSELEALLASHRAFDLELSQTRRFPGVLYLAPHPETELRALTSAVAARWPEAPPYSGQFEDVVPHLTIADGQESEVIDLVEADVLNRLLPIRTRAQSVHLIAYDGNRWNEIRSFPLSERQA